MNQRASHRVPFASAGFFAFRTPLLPFQELLRISDGVEAPRANPSELEAALARDRARIRERVRRLLERPEVREALFLASPSLDAQLSRWYDDPDSEAGRKVERTLVRYVARMSARATPFGLFAGCSVGTLGGKSRIEIGQRSDYERHTRLDMSYLFALTEALQHSHEWRTALKYRPNSSLYEVAGRLRCIQGRLEGAARSYRLVSVEPTQYLRDTLSRARNGATVGDLASALHGDDAEIAIEEAEAYVHTLVDQQLLEAEIQPQITGEEPTGQLVHQLRASDRLKALGDCLDCARAAIEALDLAGVGQAPSRYRQIAGGLEALPAKVELARLFQVDLIKPAPHATLGTNVLDEVKHAILLMARLNGRRDDALRGFKQAFIARYGGREVPLVEVLDEADGIGFDSSASEASPLLAGIRYLPPAESRRVSWDRREALLAQRLVPALERRQVEVQLDEDELAPLLGTAEEGVRSLPDSFAFAGSLVAASSAALDAGEFRIQFRGVLGPSGARLLGRFTHAEPRLAHYVVALLRHEEALNPDAIFAEIVHLPEGRLGNILVRPLLRKYEIEFLGRSGAEEANRLPITDLMISVTGDAVVLRSRRLNRRIIPRLTTAHNFSQRSLGIYRFLCSLQETAGAVFGWGGLNEMPYLPRLVVGKLVLALQTWRVDGEYLSGLAQTDQTARFTAVRSMRHERNMPRFVAVEDGDRSLPFDLDNALSVDAFAHLVKNRSAVKVTEVYPEFEQLCATGPEGRFNHDIVVPFTKLRTPTVETQSTRRTSSLPRSMPPGSDWLYMKLYGGAATLDGVLCVLASAIRRARFAGAADGWFFVRYADPDWHLRLRFRGDPKRLREEVLPVLWHEASELHAAGRIWKVALDTYERETERYGGARAIALVERIFEADSVAVLAILEHLGGDEGLDARWRLCIRGVDQLLSDLSLTEAEKHKLVSRCEANLIRELRVDVRMKREFGIRFRDERVALDGLLDQANDDRSGYQFAFKAFLERTTNVRPIAAALLEAVTSRSAIEEIAASLVHMHCNRLLRSSGREHEVMIYYFLDRIYTSRAKRLMRSPSTSR